MSTPAGMPSARWGSRAAATARARLAAAAAAAGAAAHLTMLPVGGWMAAFGVGMAAACLPCAWHMWRRPTGRIARALVAMSLAMVLVQAVLVLAPEQAAGHGTAAHGHAATNAASQAPAPGVAGADRDDGHAGAMLAVVGADLVAALLAAAWMGAARRARARRATGEGWAVSRPRSDGSDG